MRRTVLSLAVAGMLASSPSLAAEMPAESRRDLACLILFADVGNGIENQTEEQKIGFSSILGYFYGKILARDATFNLKAALTPEMLQTARTATETARQACSNEAKIFGDAFTAAAEILDK